MGSNLRTHVDAEPTHELGGEPVHAANEPVLDGRYHLARAALVVRRLWGKRAHDCVQLAKLMAKKACKARLMYVSSDESSLSDDD